VAWARLGRKVAVKALPAEFASDPERLARFEQIHGFDDPRTSIFYRAVVNAIVIASVHRRLLSPPGLVLNPKMPASPADL